MEALLDGWMDGWTDRRTEIVSKYDLCALVYEVMFSRTFLWASKLEMKLGLGCIIFEITVAT